MSTETVRSPSNARTTVDTLGTAIAWLATALLVLLALGTLTESQPGTPLRLALGTFVHATLALFAAPPVRAYLAREHDLVFNRATVALVVLVGVVVNEGLITPELA